MGNDAKDATFVTTAYKRDDGRIEAVGMFASAEGEPPITVRVDERALPIDEGDTVIFEVRPRA
jgi:hypothetical protein